MERPSTGFQTIGSLLSDISSNAESVASTESNSPTLSGDTISAREAGSSDGISPSTLGSPTNHGLVVLRDRPLTESQLTEITSKLARQWPVIFCTTSTRYGRKLIGQGDEAYYVENEPIGEQIELSVRLEFKPGAELPMLGAALALNRSTAAYERHIQRLAHHKKLGDTPAQIGIKIVDYAVALSAYPEYVVAAVCRSYIENDRRPFVAFIDEMKEACGKLRDTLERHRTAIKSKDAPRLEPPKDKPKAHRSDRPRVFWEREDWEAEIEALRNNVALAHENPKVMSTAIWEKRLAETQAAFLQASADGR